MLPTTTCLSLRSTLFSLPEGSTAECNQKTTQDANNHISSGRDVVDSSSSSFPTRRRRVFLFLLMFFFPLYQTDNLFWCSLWNPAQLSSQFSSGCFFSAQPTQGKRRRRRIIFPLSFSLSLNKKRPLNLFRPEREERSREKYQTKRKGSSENPLSPPRWCSSSCCKTDRLSPLFFSFFFGAV